MASFLDLAPIRHIARDGHFRRMRKLDAHRSKGWEHTRSWAASTQKDNISNRG